MHTRPGFCAPQVRHKVNVINQDPPAICSPAITKAAASAAEFLGLSTKHMVSRAYHDSLFMARWGPDPMA